MATHDHGTLFGVRNLLRTYVNKQRSGFFLLEYLRRINGSATRIANNNKLLKQFIELLEQHPNITVVTLKNDKGEERVWVHGDHHKDQPYPEGWYHEHKGGIVARPPQTPDVSSQYHQVIKEVEPVESPEEPKETPDVIAVPHPTTLAIPAQKEDTMSELTSNELAAKAEELRLGMEALLSAAKATADREREKNLLAEVKATQLEISRATAILQRLMDEQMEAQDLLNRSTDKLRALLGGR